MTLCGSMSRVSCILCMCVPLYKLLLDVCVLVAVVVVVIVVLLIIVTIPTYQRSIPLFGSLYSYMKISPDGLSTSQEYLALLNPLFEKPTEAD